MYAIKQAQLIMGALPIADVTIYYIDIRAFGKGYEEFYEQAKGMGVNFVKGRWLVSNSWKMAGWHCVMKICWARGGANPGA